jgi:hypothetical protein
MTEKVQDKPLVIVYNGTATIASTSAKYIPKCDYCDAPSKHECEGCHMAWWCGASDACHTDEATQHDSKSCQRFAALRADIIQTGEHIAFNILYNLRWIYGITLRDYARATAMIFVKYPDYDVNRPVLMWNDSPSHVFIQAINRKYHHMALIVARHPRMNPEALVFPPLTDEDLKAYDAEKDKQRQVDQQPTVLTKMVEIIDKYRNDYSPDPLTQDVMATILMKSSPQALLRRSCPGACSPYCRPAGAFLVEATYVNNTRPNSGSPSVVPTSPILSALLAKFPHGIDLREACCNCNRSDMRTFTARRATGEHQQVSDTCATLCPHAEDLLITRHETASAFAEAAPGVNAKPLLILVDSYLFATPGYVSPVVAIPSPVR